MTDVEIVFVADERRRRGAGHFVGAVFAFPFKLLWFLLKWSVVVLAWVFWTVPMLIATAVIVMVRARRNR